ncbi:MAG TPA: MarR family transcriptional regulator [Gemmatimonadaceae bacterium]|jgi:DNA-binding MarR family transcriptional regulator
MNDSYHTQSKAGTAEADDKSIFALLEAAHALEAKVEAALERAGLSSPKYSVLSALVASQRPLSLSELANELSCVRSNMTQLVDRLESDGLVRRVHCPNDRRLVHAEITDEGRARQANGADEIAQLHRDFSAKVQPDDRAALERLLSALG